MGQEKLKIRFFFNLKLNLQVTINQWQQLVSIG